LKKFNVMSRNKVSIFLSLLFVLLISAPTVISIVGDSIDIAVFFDSSEEEEEKGQEKNIELELLFSNLDHEDLNISCSEVGDNLGYYFKTYPKPHLNIVSPPPDQYIL